MFQGYQYHQNIDILVPRNHEFDINCPKTSKNTAGKPQGPWGRMPSRQLSSQHGVSFFAREAIWSLNPVSPPLA